MTIENILALGKPPKHRERPQIVLHALFPYTSGYAPAAVNITVQRVGDKRHPVRIIKQPWHHRKVLKAHIRRELYAVRREKCTPVQLVPDVASHRYIAQRRLKRRFPVDTAGFTIQKIVKPARPALIGVAVVTADNVRVCAFRRGVQPPDILRGNKIIAVNKCDIISPHVFKSRVPRTRQTAVLAGHHADKIIPRRKAFQYLTRAVGRAVIYRDYLVVNAAVLIYKRHNAAREEFFGVVDRHNHADRRHGVFVNCFHICSFFVFPKL